MRLLDANHLVLATPQQWDMLSRRWKQRKAVQAVGLFIADELQLLGGTHGPTLEVRGGRGCCWVHAFLHAGGVPSNCDVWHGIDCVVVEHVAQQTQHGLCRCHS